MSTASLPSLQLGSASWSIQWSNDFKNKWSLLSWWRATGIWRVLTLCQSIMPRLWRKEMQGLLHPRFNDWRKSIAHRTFTDNNCSDGSREFEIKFPDGNWHSLAARPFATSLPYILMWLVIQINDTRVLLDFRHDRTLRIAATLSNSGDTDWIDFIAALESLNTTASAGVGVAWS